VFALIGCATLGTAGAYAYRTNYFGRGSTQTAQSQAQPAQRGAPPAVAANGAVGGYIVQVSARRSKADALIGRDIAVCLLAYQKNRRHLPAIGPYGKVEKQAAGQRNDDIGYLGRNARQVHNGQRLSTHGDPQ